MGAFVADISDFGYRAIAYLSLYCEIPLLSIREVIRVSRTVLRATSAIVGSGTDVGGIFYILKLVMCKARRPDRRLIFPPSLKWPKS